GQRRGRISENGEALLRSLVGDDFRAGILERLAGGDVVVVVMAVDEVLDRLVGDLPDLGDVSRPTGRTPIGDRVGGDHAVPGDDEHRLVIAVAEEVYAFRAVDLRRRDLRACRRLRPGRGRRRQPAGKSCKKYAFHVSSFVDLSDALLEQAAGRDYSPWTGPLSPCYLDWPGLSRAGARRCYHSRNVPARFPDPRMKIDLERKYWKQYMEAYEACLAATSTRHAPWYVVPADDKPNARLIVSRIVVDTLDALDMSYPEPDAARRRELQAIRKRLAK